MKQEKLFDLLKAAVSPCECVKAAKQELLENGFEEIDYTGDWKIQPIFPAVVVIARSECQQLFFVWMPYSFHNGIFQNICFWIFVDFVHQCLQCVVLDSIIAVDKGDILSFGMLDSCISSIA